MKYKKTTLKNGLRVITVPMQDTQTATVVVMVGVGSRYETEAEAGISHFIEHMLFKGTEKRPTFLDISEELDSIGGDFNAFTGQDRTGYYAKADGKYIEKIIDVVADIYLNSKIEAVEIEKEKGTIIQEINMYEDTPTRVVADVYEKLMYSENPLGRSVIGYKKTIHSFQRSDFLKYKDRFYVANDTVICVAGKINEKKVIHLIRKCFSKMSKGKKPHFEPVVERQTKPALKIRTKKTDQTHFILGTRALREDHKDRYALGVLTVILGGNMSSRIFVEVREKKGLAYRVNTFIEAFQECGYIATQAGVEHRNLGETISVILAEYKKISTEKVSPKELQGAKDYIKGKSVMGLEASDEVAMFLLEQELKRKKILLPAEIFQKIDAVTSEDILRVAKKVFNVKNLNLAVIGPHKNTEKIEKLLKI